MRSPPRIALVGLVGAIVMMIGSGLLVAATAGKFSGDEPAHVGYLLHLRQGGLPSIDTEVPEDPFQPGLQEAIEADFRPTFIHVANNPPFPYAIGLPFGEVTGRAGVDGGVLLGLRLSSVLGAAVAVAFTFLLGREVAHDRQVGVGSACFVALPGVAVVTSVAAVDGPALGATAAVTWALVRFVREPDRPRAWMLGIAAAAASAVRPMSLAYAVLACAIAAAVAIWQHRRALGAAGAVVVRLAAPAVVSTGWFYVLNIVRYGDPTASEALFEKLGLNASDRSFTETLFSQLSLIDPLNYIIVGNHGSDFDPFGSDPWPILGLLASFVVAAAISLIRARAGDRGSLGREALMWFALSALVLLAPVLTSYHYAGGGGLHPRYLLPCLPMLAVGMAVVLRRIHHWVLAAGVALMALTNVDQIHGTAERLRDGAESRPDGVLHGTIAGGSVQTAALVLCAIGAIVCSLGAAQLARVESRRELGRYARRS